MGPQIAFSGEDEVDMLGSGEPCLGARLRGRTATQHSKKGSEKVLGKGSGKGSGEGFWGRV